MYQLYFNKKKSSHLFNIEVHCLREKTGPPLPAAPQPLLGQACSCPGAGDFSPLGCGFCRGAQLGLLDPSFWKPWQGGRAGLPCSQTSLLCGAATSVCLCSGFIRHLRVCLPGGRGKGMQMSPLNSACLGQRKTFGRNEGNEP